MVDLPDSSQQEIEVQITQVWHLCRIARKMVHYQERSIRHLHQLQENDFLPQRLQSPDQK